MLTTEHTPGVVRDLAGVGLRFGHRAISFPRHAVGAIRHRLDDALRPTVVGGPAGTSRLALTFDDGPDPGLTTAIADLLWSSGHRATFFVLVPRAERNRTCIERLRAQGHEIGLHGIEHVPLTKRSASEVAATFDEGRSRLERLGVSPRLFRPPYGAQSRSTYDAARRSGLTVVCWSHDLQDYLDPDLPTVTGRLAAFVEPGSIILMHDGNGDPPGPDLTAKQCDLRLAAVACAVELLERRALVSVTVSDLIADRPRTRSWLT